MRNIDSFLKSVDENLAYLIEDPINICYLTGYPTDSGVLLVFCEKVYFITDFRYIEAAEKHFLDSDVKVILQTKLSEDISGILKDCGGPAVCIEAGYQTVSRLGFYEKICKVNKSGDLDKILSELRSIKQPLEIKAIKSAQALTDKAFTHILNYIKEGVTEREIALELEFFMRKNGAEGVSFDIIAVSGKNSSLPHGFPTDKLISKGDFLTIDMGCKVNGYCSDMTRTVAVGYVTDEMQRVYDIVSRAQQAALNSIRAGAVCKDVDAAARDIITAEGYGDCFGHGTGHGVGLYIHEEPRLSVLSDTVLREGMVVTVEPGIYIKNKFGVRIEDMVVVTQNGCENLTGSDKSLIIL